MSVKIRMKMMGRKHRPFFRICAVDSRRPRDGRVIEELGTYDPMVGDTDARVSMNDDRVAYWLSVGAQPSQNVKVLIKKYGPDGTHRDAQKTAVEKLKAPKAVPAAPEPVFVPQPKPEKPAAAPAAEAPAEAAEPAETAASESEETAAAEPAEEAAAEPAAE